MELLGFDNVTHMYTVSAQGLDYITCFDLAAGMGDV